MPISFKDQRGFAPLLLLVVLAVGLVAGGSYVVKNNLVTTENGQIVFNAAKDKSLQDIKIPAPQSDTTKVIPTPKKVELAEKTAEYKPTNTNEPQFSINPPAGWVKGVGRENIKLRFDAPQEDKTEIGNANASLGANIQVYVEKTNAKNTDELMADFKAQAAKVPFSIDVQNEKKTTFAGEEAIYFEILISMPDVDYKQLESYVKQKSGGEQTPSTQDIKDMMQSFRGKSIGYTMLKNGYRVDVGGTAAGWAWDKRSGAIQSSINTFKFLDNGSTQKQPDPTSYNSSPQTNKNTIPVFTIDNPDGWTNLSIPNALTADYHSAEIDHPYDPNTHVRINIKRVYSSDLQQVVNKFKQNLPGSKVIQAQNLTVNGLPGYLAEYKELGDDDYNQRHIYYFISFKDGFEINVAGRTFQRTWDKNGDTIKKAVNSFKLK